MSRERLPPQAYTKETLSNAIGWLQTQPEHVKSLVRTQDALIALYLKWKRNGNAAIESLSPAAQERLRTDLKSIRSVMDQFEPTTTPVQNPTVPVAQNPVASAGASLSVASGTPVAAEILKARETLNASQVPDASASIPDVPTPVRATPENSGAARPAQDASPHSGLDVESQRRLATVRERLNLSSDQEALRMLISLGFDRIRDTLPRSEDDADFI